MSKNAIAVTNINFDSIFKYTFPFFEKYSKKTGADLIIIDRKTININKEGYVNNRFENLQVGKYLETYDRIFLLDCDVILKPECPDYFDTDPKNLYISRVDLYDNRRLESSVERVKLVQSQLGKIVGWTQSYFNSGVMMVSKEHIKLFDYNINKLNSITGKTRISNFYNWNARKLKYSLVDLGPKFNYFGSYELLAGIKKEEANILHYPGPKDTNSINFNSIVNDSNYYLGINKSII